MFHKIKASYFIVFCWGWARMTRCPANNYTTRPQYRKVLCVVVHQILISPEISRKPRRLFKTDMTCTSKAQPGQFNETLSLNKN